MAFHLIWSKSPNPACGLQVYHTPIIFLTSIDLAQPAWCHSSSIPHVYIQGMCTLCSPWYPHALQHFLLGSYIKINFWMGPSWKWGLNFNHYHLNTSYLLSLSYISSPALTVFQQTLFHLLCYSLSFLSSIILSSFRTRFFACFVYCLLHNT